MNIETIQIETNIDKLYMEWENTKMYLPLVVAFINLLKSLTTYDINTGETVRIQFYSAMSWSRYTVEKNQGLALVRLGKEINEGLAAMFEKGKNNGKDMLGQLANGEITECQFLK